MLMGLVYKPVIEAVDLAKKICKLATNIGFKVSTYTRIDDNIPVFDLERDEQDYIVVIGGDGTLARTCKKVAGKKTEILTVKKGRRAYLMELNENEIEKGIKELLMDHQVEELRIGEFVIKDKKSYFFNDIALMTTEGRTVLITVKTLGNKREIEGDGIIISTPQGSPAWNFSAGGPIVYGIKSYIITPMNPVNRLSSLVIPEVEINLSIGSKFNQPKVLLSADGENIAKIEEGDEITVLPSTKSVKIARLKGVKYIHGWFE